MKIYPASIGEKTGVLGIDPGKSGGLAFGDAKGIITTYPMPMRGNEVDVCELQDLLIIHKPAAAFVERQQSRNGQAAQAIIMQNFGAIIATLTLCGVITAVVTPQIWQSALGLDGDKAGHIKFAQRFADIPWTSYKQDGSPMGRAKLHDGIADAVCILRYGVAIKWGIA